MKSAALDRLAEWLYTPFRRKKLSLCNAIAEQRRQHDLQAVFGFSHAGAGFFCRPFPSHPEKKFESVSCFTRSIAHPLNLPRGAPHW
jgi:hypothetical protein